MDPAVFNLERIREAFKGSEERCPWQRLTDLGYREWQKPENRKWCYRDMIEWVGENYGEVVKLFILLGAGDMSLELQRGLIEIIYDLLAKRRRVSVENLQSV